MSAIRERTALCVVDLPKPLTSRRNLHAHFSKFSEVVAVSMDKALRTGIVQFSSHFGAQTGKTQGKMYNGEPLNIFWSEGTILDPRAKEKKEYTRENEPLWVDDDKECFGIEPSSPSKDENKSSAKDMIKKHLKLTNIKKRVGPSIKTKDAKKSQLVPISPFKVSNSKSEVSLKKTIIQASKQKILKKEREKIMKKKIVSVLKKHIDPPDTCVASFSEQTDLKHKLALLDERDKLIRQETVQDSDIKTAVAIKGTCADMCPERERILRQIGQQISTYEMLPGTDKMDENRAVKEYVRSSADQDVPLPHDLRPEPVLSMTMNYLITNVINRIDNPDEKKGLWYSFCWNRLRSIRKDIILQQLCDLETVKIVEQCARFHICCYDHMRGAEVGGFDDKINTQNVIDCLQTLRHMYKDLAKHGIKCPNESEFYSYLILLKLTSGDVIWEYQEYSREVQSSPRVRFAIEAYMAFKNNMYSKYFSLVKRASYLEACLMQRHFDIIRTKAIKIMLKAYSLPNKSCGLTTSFLKACLKFDSQSNALRFFEGIEGCSNKGLKLDFDLNEDEYITTSSFLIKEKRLPIANAVVGENNSLPVYVPHQVHSSFDENGKLIDSPEVNVSEDLIDTSEESPIKEPEVIKKDVDNKQSFKFSLSPKAVKDNDIVGSVFPRLGPVKLEQRFGESVESKILSKDDFNKPESFVCSSQPSNEVKDDNSNSFKMEDFDQEMAYEDDKHDRSRMIGQYSEDIKYQQVTTPLDIHNNRKFGFHQTFPITTTASSDNNSFFKDLGINKPASQIFNDKTSPKPVSEEKLKFSFPSFPQNENSEFYQQNAKENQAQNIKKDDLFKYRRISQESYQIIKTHEYTSPFNKIPSNNVSLGSIHKDLKSYCDTEEQPEEDNIRNSEELTQGIMVKIDEEEKAKLEEIKRAEIEKQKSIEAQKVLLKLKKDLRQRMKAINARKYARYWKSRVEKLKQTRSDFPMLQQLSVTTHLSLWGSLKSVPKNSIYQRAKDKQNSATVVLQLLQTGITDSCRYIGSSLAESIASFAAKTMNKGVIKPVFWKLGISLPWASKPASELAVFNQLMKRWCRQSFYKEENSTLGSVESIMTSLQIQVNMSIHVSDDLQTCHDLLAMDGLIFIVLNESESEKMCLQRLRCLVTNNVRSGELSVAVMNINGNKFDRVLKMELEELHEQNMIAYWSIRNWLSPSSIMESLSFLAEHVTIVQHIYASPLDLLVKQVTEDFFDSLSSSQHLCKEAFKNPNHIIYIYNTCLTKLEDLLMSSKLEKYFNFAEEFKTHIPMNESGGPELMCGKQYDDQYKSQISKKINALKLPEFAKWPAKSTNRLIKMLKTYCGHVHDKGVFSQVVRMLDLQDDVELMEQLESAPWLNIVEVWAESRIRHLFTSKEKGKRIFVVFNKNDVQRMVRKQWWLKLPIIVQSCR